MAIEGTRLPVLNFSGTGSAPEGAFRALGLGVVTGACDDDPVAIGTYASAGASFGASFLWTAPATLPMMYAVVYLSSKLGQVTGKGLFHVIEGPLRVGCHGRS